MKSAIDDLKELQSIASDIDQLSSRVRDCEMSTPDLQVALDVAWFLAEEALRGEGASSCGHLLDYSDLCRDDVKRHGCPCCEFYYRLHNKAHAVARLL